jgi:hypothetical protein
VEATGSERLTLGETEPFVNWLGDWMSLPRIKSQFLGHPAQGFATIIRIPGSTQMLEKATH